MLQELIVVMIGMIGSADLVLCDGAVMAEFLEDILRGYRAWFGR